MRRPTIRLHAGLECQKNAGGVASDRVRIWQRCSLHASRLESGISLDQILQTVVVLPESLDEIHMARSIQAELETPAGALEPRRMVEGAPRSRLHSETD